MSILKPTYIKSVPTLQAYRKVTKACLIASQGASPMQYPKTEDSPDNMLCLLILNLNLLPCSYGTYNSEGWNVFVAYFPGNRFSILFIESEESYSILIIFIYNNEFNYRNFQTDNKNDLIMTRYIKYPLTYLRWFKYWVLKKPLSFLLISLSRYLWLMVNKI